MSLVGFEARNHPQQSVKRGPREDVDHRATPPELFDPLNERFGFTLDVAALPENAKCPRYFTPDDDGLSKSWLGETVWCNPPYSNIGPWVEKAWFEAATSHGIVMLVPANRCEQGWWQDHVEPFRDRGNGFSVEFLRGRRRFIGPGKDGIGPNERPPFGVALLIWEGSKSIEKIDLQFRPIGREAA